MCSITAAGCSTAWKESPESSSKIKQSWLRIGWVWMMVLCLTACRAPVSAPPLETATAQLTASPVLNSQEQALLPDFRADMQAMGQAPHYTIQVEIDPLAAAFQGSLQLQYANQESAALDQLFLRLYPNDGASYGPGSLEVTDITLDGQAVTRAASQAASIVKIALPAPLPPGGQALLELRFKGQAPRDFAGEEQGAYGIYNLSEQVLVLSGWYPILAVYDADGWNLDRVNPVGDAVYSDMATYQVQVKLPADYTLAATGVQVESQTVGETAITTYVSGPAREFALAASPRFGVVTESVDRVRVNVYYLDEAQAQGQDMLAVAVDSLKTFDHLFAAYPYAELDIVQTPLHNAGGVEFPGIVFIEAERFLDSAGPVAVTTVAHEVAHQWWYNLVGNDVIDEPWLDEALASYSSALYWESIEGSEAYNAVLADFQAGYDRSVEKGLAGQITQGMEYYGLPEHAPAYGAVVYRKGALFFDALRQEIGDQAFFTALQQYYQRRRYQIATADDLLSAFEAAAGRPLDDFYQAWLY